MKATKLTRFVRALRKAKEPSMLHLRLPRFLFKRQVRYMIYGNDYVLGKLWRQSLVGIRALLIGDGQVAMALQVQL